MTKEEYIEKMKPWMDRIEPFKDFSEEEIKKVHKYRHTESIESTRELLSKSFHLQCAQVLKALETSWSNYDTYESLQEILDFTFQENDKVQKCCIHLDNLGLIERQRRRVRATKK